jgi:phospholipid transport system substrate-binding protein
MNKTSFILFLSIAVAVCTAETSVAADSPLELMRTTVEGIIATLKNKDLSAETRRAQIRSLASKRFSYQAMSQRVLGKNWKQASKEQQQHFVDLFSELLEATYMGRVEAYTDEEVRYDREKIEGKRAVVDTVIVTASAEIPIQYKMGLIKGEWFVYDIAVEKISLILNYRTTYAEIFRKDGMDGLLAQMEAKIKEIRKARDGN